MQSLKAAKNAAVDLNKLHENWVQLSQLQRWRLLIVALLFVVNNYLEQKAQSLIPTHSESRATKTHASQR